MKNKEPFFNEKYSQFTKACDKVADDNVDYMNCTDDCFEALSQTRWVYGYYIIHRSITDNLIF